MKTMNRSEFIGGSDIAGVMGLSRWKTPLKLWAEKLGKLQEQETSEAAELGTELEDFVARKFMKVTGIKVRRAPKIYTHKDYEFMRCQVDRLVEGTDDLLECKTCGAWVAKDWAGEEIPMEYILQVNWQLGITGRSTGYIAVLIGGQKFLWKKIEFNQELFDREVNFALTFWNEFILKNEPPMAVSGDSDTLLDMFPSSKAEVIEIKDPESMDDINTALERRLEVIKEIDMATKDKEDIDAKIKQIIGEAGGIKTDRFTITWANQSRTSADVDKLKEAGIFDQYSKTTTTRVFRVKGVKHAN